jgi:hypothetical protein
MDTTRNPIIDLETEIAKLMHEPTKLWNVLLIAEPSCEKRQTFRVESYFKNGPEDV